MFFVKEWNEKKRVKRKGLVAVSDNSMFSACNHGTVGIQLQSIYLGVDGKVRENYSKEA